MPIFCHNRPKTSSCLILVMDTGSVSPAAWASITFDPLTIAQPAAYKPIKLSALLEDVQPANCGDDFLANRFATAHTAGNLQVAVSFGGFDSEKHSVSCWTPRIKPSQQGLINRKPRQ